LAVTRRATMDVTVGTRWSETFRRNESIVIAEHPSDSRHGLNTQFRLPDLKPLIRYKSFHHQADSWTTPRRVVAKVEHHVGELFPRVGFIVTNLPLPNRAVVRFYNMRGTTEQWIKEGKQARTGRGCRVIGSGRTRSGSS
jgi:Transposase DDE domain group 1